MGKFRIKKYFISPMLAERFAHDLGRKLGKRVIMSDCPDSNEGYYFFEIVE